MAIHRNKVFLRGNVGDVPEPNETNSGTKVLNFPLAVNKNFKDDYGQWQTETTWVTIDVWGDEAERFVERTSQGDRIFIEGRLKQSEWEDKHGNDQSQLKVTAYGVDYIDGGKEQQDEPDEILDDVDVSPDDEPEDEIPF